ncbi:hypothetical protein [Chromobacterium phragmitis]|uniref:Uncharacterized protein n=1 Tax=Chromobacterium phragmitis TaxID=2202141 RepID=A0ABV0J0N1_9NEIS
MFKAVQQARSMMRSNPDVTVNEVGSVLAQMGLSLAEVKAAINLAVK